jgi:peptide/nickel transport system substrate-binding protein
MRKLYWYVTTYIKKHGWLLAISILGALVIFSFSISLIVQKLEFKKRRYIGLVGSYTLFDLPRPIQEKLSAGLTKVEPDDTVSPYVAERWTVEDDGKTYRFVIKKKLFWQDGQELTPSDVNYNFQNVEVITTPNDVVFKLPDVYVPFPTVAALPLLRTTEEPYLWFFKRPTLIGLGEYELEDYSEDGQKLTQVVLDNATERLIYRFYLTESDAVLAFKRGEVDELPDFSSSYDIANWPNVGIQETLNTNQYLAVFFNNASPIFPKNVRQALSYALEKPTGVERAYGPINPLSWAYLEGGRSYDKDLDRAVERMLDEPPSQPINFELTTTGTFSQDAEQIKQQWESFGQLASEKCQQNGDIKDKNVCNNVKVQVVIRVTNFPDTSNFQALLIGQQIPPDPDQYHLWHSDQSTNFTQYKNTRIDALLEKGRTTPEKTERRALYQEFQQFFLEDAPAVFLRHLKSYDITRT